MVYLTGVHGVLVGSPPYPSLTNITINCPFTYPYLLSVITVESDADANLNTTSDRYPLSYTTTTTGVVINSIQEGHRWLVEMTCSVTRPTTTSLR